MPTYVALLRGINVGGRRALKMATLRAAVETAGATEVETYIQSGNVVFVHPARRPGAVQAELAERIASAAGFEVPVLVRSGPELRAVIERNPFPAAPSDELHVLFCEAKPAASAFARLDPEQFAPERWAVVGRELYLRLPGGIGRSKLAATIARTPPMREATARNWRTVETLGSMAAARAR